MKTIIQIVFCLLLFFSIASIILGIYVWKNKKMISLLGKKKIEKKYLLEYSKYASETYLVIGLFIIPDILFVLFLNQKLSYLSIVLWVVEIVVVIRNQLKAKKEFGCGIGIL